jgi:hypothetical protein
MSLLRVVLRTYLCSGELWVGPAAMIYIVQDPANETTTMDKNLLAVP